MNIFEKLISRIKSIFKNLFSEKQKMLPQFDKIDKLQEDVGNQIIKINEPELELNFEFNSNMHTKEEFMKMYQDYKDGKIKEEYLLITDLLDIQLMMIEEEKMLNRKIANEEENIRNQEMQLSMLINQKMKLENN